MAVMSPQPPISAQEHKPSSVAPTPASAGAGSMASDEAMGMDLDTHGTNKNESTSALTPSFPKEEFDTNGARSTFVNGNPKGITAPPSPPIPTPPLLNSTDNAHDLSDLHITSPNGSFAPGSANSRFSDRMDVQEVNSDSNGQGAGDHSDSRSSENKSETKSKDSDRPEASTHSEDKTMTDVPVIKKTARDRDDDDGEDRPPKRAKTEDAPDSKLSLVTSAIFTEFSGPMTPSRSKFILGVIRSIRRTRDARPFSMPVDAVKLNIPTYYSLIKRPMDLQTIERKLNGSEYVDVDTLNKDFQLILYNCELFNGTDHAVTTMSKGMASSFYRQMSDLPGENVVESEKPKPAKKKGGNISVAAKTTASKTTIKSSAAKVLPTKKETKPTAQTPAATSPVFSLQPSGMPQIRRDSTLGDGRPKREIHPPAPKDLPYATKPRRKQNAAELKFCDTILKELHKKCHAEYAFPFYAPVDPVALNIPDYFKIVKKPMDLSTIQEKLKTNSYEDSNEFEEDIRLMFNNCYKFNPQGQAVHQMGRRLEAVFEQKWKDKPTYTRNNLGSRSPQSTSPVPQEYEEMSEEEGDDEDDQSNIAELEKKLETMKEMITAMKKGKKTPPVTNKKSAHGRKASTSKPAPSKKGNKRKDPPYITLDQKTELSERINYLPPHKMSNALEMIKQNMPELGNEDGEIELDIDELDPHTLYKLYNYVSKHAPEVPQSYVPPPPPPPPTHQEPKTKTKAGPKGRKNKPMSAAEQEQKIMDLQSRLQNFDNPGSFTAPGTHYPS
ncbi:Bromodomain-containing protein [Geopyxis carbonaria]|nr:Bromodomain-containing protein [Geopyxis carbonaria]